MSGRALSDDQFPLKLGERRWPSSPGEDAGNAGMVADWPYAEQYLDHDVELLDLPFGTPAESRLRSWRP